MEQPITIDTDSDFSHCVLLTGVEMSVLAKILSDVQNHNNKDNCSSLSVTCKAYLDYPELETASGILAKLLK